MFVRSMAQRLACGTPLLLHSHLSVWKFPLCVPYHTGTGTGTTRETKRPVRSKFNHSWHACRRRGTRCEEIGTPSKDLLARNFHTKTFPIFNQPATHKQTKQTKKRTKTDIASPIDKQHHTPSISFILPQFLFVSISIHELVGSSIANQCRAPHKCGSTAVLCFLQMPNLSQPTSTPIW